MSRFLAVLVSLCVLTLVFPLRAEQGVRPATIQPLMSLDTLRERALDLVAEFERLDRKPPELSSYVRLLLSLENSGLEADRLRNLTQMLLEFEREASIRRENSDLIGRRANGVQVYRAGKEVVYRQTVFVNTRLEKGAGILLAKPWWLDRHFQSRDPKAPDFISLKTSAPGAEWAVREVLRGGIHGGMDRQIPLPFFELVSGSLNRGDEILITVSNFELPRQSNRAFDLPIYLRLSEADAFIGIPGDPVQLVGGRAAKVRLIGPSLARTNEQLTVRLSYLDQFDNLASGTMPGLEFIIAGEFHSRLETGTAAQVDLRQFRFETENVYRISARSSGGGIGALSNPIKVSRQLEDKIIWLDAMLETSDGVGRSTFAETIGYSGSDLVAVADQVDYLDATQWQKQISVQGRKILHGMTLAEGNNGGGRRTLYWRDPKPSDLAINSLVNLRSVFSRLAEGDALVAMSASPPADPRYVFPGVPLFVNWFEKHSAFEWYGQRLAAAGHRFNLIGGDVRHGGGLTALRLKSDQANRRPWEQINQASTWVTTGKRLVLEAELNGYQPGSRQPMTCDRQFDVDVSGTDSIDVIEVIKNGQVIHRELPRERFGETAQFQDGVSGPASSTLAMSFWSPSAPPAGSWDLPRMGREWLGYVRLTGGRFVSVTAPGFDLPDRQAVVINPSDDTRVDFISWTRGRESTVYLETRGVTEDSVLELNLGPGFEDPGGPVYRQVAELPGSRQIIALSDIETGPVKRNIDGVGYRDVVQLRKFDPSRALASWQFQLQESSKCLAGDYYYVRVRQTDDEYAWSSPFWVGGSN